MRRLIEFITLYVFATLLACGGSQTPKKPQQNNPQFPGSFAAGNSGDAFSQNTECNQQTGQCPILQLAAQVSTGGSALIGYLNQGANWSISGVTSPPSSRRVLIRAEGGPPECTWSNQGGEATTCSWTPSAMPDTTNPVTVELLDADLCAFNARNTGNAQACSSIDAAKQAGMRVESRQVTWSVVDQNNAGQFNPQNFTLPEVKDRSSQYCMMGILGNGLGPLLGGNFAQGIAGGMQGCLQGYMTGQNLKNRQEMMQQQMQYQQFSNSGYGNPYNNGIQQGPYQQQGQYSGY